MNASDGFPGVLGLLEEKNRYPWLLLEIPEYLKGKVRKMLNALLRRRFRLKKMNHGKTFTSFLSIALIALIIAGLASYPLPSAAGAKSKVPTFVLGVLDPGDPLVLKLKELTSSLTLLATLSELSLVGSRSILFLDGAWLGPAASVDPTVMSVLSGKVLEGVPTVTVRGSADFLGDSISGMIRPQAPDLPLIAEGLKVYGTLPDGTRRANILQVASGFLYSVIAEFLWAAKQVSQGSTSTSSTSSAFVESSNQISTSEATIEQANSDPFWASAGNVTIDTGNFFAPVGRTITTFAIFSLQNDGTSTYKWFNFFLDQTIQPGILIYGSDWRTSAVQDSVHVFNATTNLLVDHGPGALYAAGPTVVTYDIGVVAGTDGAVVTASQTQSYQLKHTTVSVTEVPGSDVVWLHDIDARTEGKSIFQIIPGWTLRVDEAEPIQIQGAFSTTFERIQGTATVETNTITFNYSVSGG